MSRKPPNPYAAVTEKQFQQQVVDAIKAFYGDRCRVYHTWSSVHSSPGFPDLVALIPGRNGDPNFRLIVAELKRVGGKMTIEQTIWLALFRDVGAETYLWTPENMDAIVDVLRP